MGSPRINLAMFRQTAHASSIKLGLLMTLNLPGWHLQGRKCVWKRILLIVLRMVLKSFLKPLRTKKHAIYFSYHQPLFSFLPACVDTRKINLGVGVLVRDSVIVMTLNLIGWHLQVRRCVWNRILLIVRNEKFKKHNKYTPNLFSFCANKVFPFSQLAWPRVKLIWGLVYWFGSPWFESDEIALISCMQCLLQLPLLLDVLNHAYGLGWPHWRPYVPETVDTFTPALNNLANHSTPQFFRKKLFGVCLTQKKILVPPLLNNFA